ncbi:MAG: hypothetical protein H6871_00045 [Methylobacteriaceae bacterium]|nr:hypothetical protein [Methylobacteriaceae bacterium]
MISDLFGQLNETRSAAFEAAEEAARAAARESVREALASTAGAGQAEIGRELADLRATQDASDQRTHATLKAVHATLERVVDRLATLEGDIGEELARASGGAASGSPTGKRRRARKPAPRRAALASPVVAAVAPRRRAPSMPPQGSTISAAAALARLRAKRSSRVEARPQRAAAAALAR